jgi:hypothetical protein
MFGERRRHCSNCHTRIERTVPHLRIVHYGVRANLCRECVIHFAEQVKFMLYKEVNSEKKKTS